MLLLMLSGVTASVHVWWYSPQMSNSQWTMCPVDLESFSVNCVQSWLYWRSKQVFNKYLFPFPVPRIPSHCRISGSGTAHSGSLLLFLDPSWSLTPSSVPRGIPAHVVLSPPTAELPPAALKWLPSTVRRWKLGQYSQSLWCWLSGWHSYWQVFFWS